MALWCELNAFYNFPFILYSAYMLWTEYSMTYTPITALVLLLCVLTMFFVVSCIDPGIIPRPEEYERSHRSTDVLNYVSRHQDPAAEVKAVKFTPPWEQRINVGGHIAVCRLDILPIVLYA